MSRKNNFKYFTLVLLLFTFIAASSLSSCREQKKTENTEQQGEHPESDEQSAKDEHPAKADEEHPAKEGDEHPAKEDEHPTKE